jgi:hypothetical protein
VEDKDVVEVARGRVKEYFENKGESGSVKGKLWKSGHENAWPRVKSV